MNTCDTCKWWTPPIEEIRGGEKPEVMICVFGTCRNPLLNLVDVVMVKKRAHKYKSAPRPDGASTHEETMLGCGPRFGCIHHQPK